MKHAISRFTEGLNVVRFVLTRGPFRPERGPFRPECGLLRLKWGPVLSVVHYVPNLRGWGGGGGGGGAEKVVKKATWNEG